MPMSIVSNRLHRGALLLVTASGAALSPLCAQTAIPPDSVVTVFTSDTLSEFGAVGGVAVDALGFVYVADFRNAVWRITPEGHVSRFADGLYGASGNAVGPRGFLFQSSFNGNYVSRISRDGRVETWASQGLSGPVGIAVDAEGDLYVCNCVAGTIGRIGADRVARTFSESELFACPNGITFDDRGDLYVVNFNNDQVVRITPDGTATSFARVQGAGGNGHIAFARGGFYVTQFRGERVFRLDRDGAVSRVAGTGERGETDGSALEATFSSPNGIAASPTGNQLWINDYAGPLTRGTGAYVAMRRIDLVSLREVLGRLPAGGTDAVRSAYSAYRESRPGVDTRSDAIALGFLWLSTGRFTEALTLFQLNAEAHRDDPSSQFNLGEAYRHLGQPEQAAAQYERTLELDPDHPQAQARLELVRSGPPAL